MTRKTRKQPVKKTAKYNPHIVRENRDYVATIEVGIGKMTALHLKKSGSQEELSPQWREELQQWLSDAFALKRSERPLRLLFEYGGVTAGLKSTPPGEYT